MTAPKQFSAYLVTSSSEESMPVGTMLIEKGIQLERYWTIADFDSGKESGVVGVRIARLCATCKVKHNRVGLADHGDPCGSDEAKEQAREFLASEKRQRQAVTR